MASMTPACAETGMTTSIGFFFSAGLAVFGSGPPASFTPAQELRKNVKIADKRNRFIFQASWSNLFTHGQLQFNKARLVVEKGSKVLLANFAAGALCFEHRQ